VRARDTQEKSGTGYGLVYRAYDRRQSSLALVSSFSRFFFIFRFSLIAPSSVKFKMARRALSTTKSFFWVVAAASILLIVSLSAVAHSLVPTFKTADPKRQQEGLLMSNDDTCTNNEEEFRVAFLGNSMLYFNDCPRLFEQMLMTRYVNKKVRQDSCLRGGASLVSLWEKGNGMGTKFATPPAALPNSNEYDIGALTVQALLSEGTNVVVLNDHTKSPARTKTRQSALAILREKYLPLFKQQQQNNCNLLVIFIQTPAYRFPNMLNTEDLGDFDEYTDRLAEGYREYMQLIKQDNQLDCRVAPVGEAFRWLRRENSKLWEKLYSWDNFHPSPHGTWLQACVLYCTLIREAPPMYQPTWWDQSRYMQPPDQDPLPRPTLAEAEELRQVAWRVCGVEI
jgi:hypothetical protein